MKKENKLIKKLSLFVIFLVLFVFVLILINSNFFGEISDSLDSPKLISIEDNCGVIYGNLLHDIKSEDNCRIRCVNECGLQERDFLKIEFIQKYDSCNECNCYCK